MNRHRIDAGERFVEQDDARLGDEAAGNLQAPLLTAGDVVGLRLADTGDVKLLEQFLAAAAALLPIHPHQFHDRQQILFHRELAEHALLLGQIAHPTVAGPLVHRPVGDVVVVEQHPAGIGDYHAAGHPEAGGFAGAVGPEQADDLAGLDMEIDTIHHPAAAVVLHQSCDRQQRHGLLREAVRAAGRAFRQLAHKAHPREVGP